MCFIVFYIKCSANLRTVRNKREVWCFCCAGYSVLLEDTVKRPTPMEYGVGLFVPREQKRMLVL